MQFASHKVRTSRLLIELFILVSQESVCGTFGSGLLSACLVDVGANKTSICCIEDGISIPSTRYMYFDISCIISCI